MRGSLKRLSELWTILPNPYTMFLFRFKAGEARNPYRSGSESAPAGLTCEDGMAMVVGETGVLGTSGKGGFCFWRSRKSERSCVSRLSPTLAKVTNNYTRGSDIPFQ